MKTLIERSGFSFLLTISRSHSRLYKKLKSKLFKKYANSKKFIFTPDVSKKEGTKLLKEGKFLSGAFEVIGKPEAASLCHYLTLAFRKHFKGSTAYRGYALSEDGNWRYHSWVKHEGRLLELTPCPRIAYYGYILE